MLFRTLQDNKYKQDIDKLVVMGRSVDYIHSYLKKQKENVSYDVVENYVYNWCKVKLLDAYKDYLWLRDNLEGWVMSEFSEEDILNDPEKANNFRRELLIARTEYRIHDMYRNTIGVDNRDYKDLATLQLNAMAHQDKLNQKGNTNTPITTSTTDLLDQDDPSMSAIDISDLEKYLYKKSPSEQQIIRNFIADLMQGRAIKVIDLEEYKKK